MTLTVGIIASECVRLVCEQERDKILDPRLFVTFLRFVFELYLHGYVMSFSQTFS